MVDEADGDEPELGDRGTDSVEHILELLFIH